MGGEKEIVKAIGEVERITGIPKREIKYCIEQKLLQPEQKSESGYWLYGEREIQELQTVVLLKKLGCPNAVIRDLIFTPPIHWKQELQRQVVRLEERQRRTTAQLITAKWLLENLAIEPMKPDLIVKALHMYGEIQN